ncbi:bifunctional 2-polyprenyl-6-hydroxyphenol methylase/3-demethylubiquinol 3-O-methyltransferase UbiG [Celerinatantimonas diazotrophica]|uniref:Ubiquinone biosynthesis O-methyltransferase n=1 Tax=Celerinatantimonas diazotrophica TaxID=412034 RepID=A0A4V2PPS7_9GAMM|nr:bifunctional 2-polyprenyl-6-hydroxyphenol methylase/3-demethylubiquinol 3-O-methyltransferase UbiG [Celerinatantimonas diazotrophica]TCK52141.1 3-demethylubiquinone-9 3-methyltransferase [Celerinatantimonas diazotrophica]CAG9296154.1 Ubiquinone biosynthesis O-methyltransferase [Celerinatantimonas diazotrophica]
MTYDNVDQTEIDKFASLASQWWDEDGDFKTLHQINPLRLEFIETHSAGLFDKQILDVGCGGGILSESMAKRGAQVTALDMGQAQIEVARLHALESQVEIDYHQVSAENFALEHPASFDVITCMEMLEHVPEPASVLQALYTMLKPGGQLFLSTVNRNPKSYLLMLVAAEKLLKLVPQGTHQYNKFIKPSELLGWCDVVGFETKHLTGVRVIPFVDIYKLSRDVSVNYMVHLSKPDI